MIKRIDSIPNRLSGVVVYNGLAYVSGQVPWNAQNDTIEKQTKDVLNAIDKLLHESGTSKHNLLSATIWLTNIMEDFDAFNVVWDEWLPSGCEPSRACVGAPLAQLKEHEFSVEIAVIAAVINE